MSAKQVVAGVHAIPVGPVNTFLLQSVDGCTLIDTGLRGSADKLLQEFITIGKQPRKIHHIILTHAHPDHIGRRSKESYGCESLHAPVGCRESRGRAEGFGR